MRNVLTVVMLEADKAGVGPVFYADPPPEGADPTLTPPEGPPPSGLRGRVEARLRRLKARWQTSDGYAARACRRVWDSLHRRAHPDEGLLIRLRAADAIEVHHPASLGEEEVSAAWSAYLARGRRRHGPWFVVNLVVAPLAVVLGPLPGPNLVFYWFAYRAVHHGLILRGLRRVRSGEVEIRLRPTRLLDRPAGGSGPPRGTAHLAALGCDPGAVDDFLGRLGACEGSAVEVSAAR